VAAAALPVVVDAGVPGVVAAVVPPAPLVAAPDGPADVVFVPALASASPRRRPGRLGWSVAVEPVALLTDPAPGWLGGLTAPAVAPLPPLVNPPADPAPGGSWRCRGCGGESEAPGAPPALAAALDPPAGPAPPRPILAAFPGPPGAARPGWPPDGSERRPGVNTWGSVGAAGSGLAVVRPCPVCTFVVAPAPAGQLAEDPAPGESKRRPAAGACCSPRPDDPPQPPLVMGAWPPADALQPRLAPWPPPAPPNEVP
jgi:hypothetical protein